MLEVTLRPSDCSWPAAQAVMLGRVTFARIAGLIGIDRPQFEALLAVAVEASIVDAQLPEFVLIRDDGSIVMPPARIHPSQTLRQWRATGGKHLVVLRELSLADVREFSDGEIVECLLLLQFVTTRPLVRTSIALALSELSGRVKSAVDAELERRARLDATRPAAEAQMPT